MSVVISLNPSLYHRIHYTFFRYSQTDVTFVLKLKRKRWFWKDSRCFFHPKNLISYNNKKRPSILIKCRKNAHLSNSIWTQVSDSFFHIVHINCFFVRKNCNLSKNDALHPPKKRTSHAFGIIWWCFFYENKLFLTKPIDFILKPQNSGYSVINGTDYYIGSVSFSLPSRCWLIAYFQFDNFNVFCLRFTLTVICYNLIFTGQYTWF